MKLTFIRADHEVTGSCTLLEIGGHYGLIDCGMEQGRDLFENIAIPVPAAQIEFVLVTHAHMDHTGHLPLLYKQGFRGTVYATEATCDLCGIMLRDAAHIQMSEAEWKGRKAARAGQPAPEPLYTLEDVEGVLRLLRPCGYGKRIQVGENIIIRFTDVGHLLGSACIEAWLTEGGTEKKIVFSGDIGNVDQPIIRDPTYLTGADYVVMESTYGDRNHTEVWSYTDDLAKIIDETIAKGGNVQIVVHVYMEDYMLGVLPYEMDNSFPLEALKAQAVAARTFTLRRLPACGGTPCGRCGADVCTDSACCQSYRSAEQLASKWGADAAYYSARVEEAVYSTAGEVATYEGALIEALYHSTAGGMTESSENVFASAQPYLVSVESPGEEGSAHYRDSITFPRKSFITKLNAAFPRAELSAKKLEVQVEITARFASGRVKTVRLGKVEVTGRQFRKALDLPSANFTIEFVGEDVRVSTKGYGHGVGMSQYGANAMAKEGSDYRAILQHYYTGISIENWGERLK